ncbi:MAG: flagellar export chaperone FliS [Methylocystaceae bacterium]
MNANAAQYYRQQSIETAGPLRLVVLLYEGAINAIDKAKEAIRTQDIATAHSQIIKTEDIIKELMSALDTSYEVGMSLMALYEFLLDRLVQANIKKDVLLLDEVRGFLADLKEAWDEVARRPMEIQKPDQGKAPVTSLNVTG